MYQIQLKVSGDQATAIADALDRDIGQADPGTDTTELRRLAAWLRYRVSLAAQREQRPPRK